MDRPKTEITEKMVQRAYEVSAEYDWIKCPPTENGQCGGISMIVVKAMLEAAITDAVDLEFSS